MDSEPFTLYTLMSSVTVAHSQGPSGKTELAKVEKESWKKN